MRALRRELPDAQGLFIRPDHADPGDSGGAAGQPSVPGPFDGKPPTRRSGVLGDHGIGLPVAQALATLRVVLVLDADHVTGLKGLRWHLLSGHGTPRKDCGHSAYTWVTPKHKGRFTTTA